MYPSAGRPRAVYLLAQSPFPPVSGASLRATNIAAALGGTFDLSVVAGDRPDECIPGWSAASERFLKRRHSRLHLVMDTLEGIVRGQHVLLVRSVRSGLLDVVERWLQSVRPSVVVLGRPLLAPYVDAARRSGGRVIVDADESLPRVAWSVARTSQAAPRVRARAAIEAALVLGRMESRAYRRVDQLWVSSDEERRELGKRFHSRVIRVIPNAIEVPGEPPSAPEVTAVCFLGWYSYPPNEAAAIELMRSIMPAVRAAGGPECLAIIGAAPTAAMARAAAEAGNVTITGEVPDVRQAMRAAGLLLVPLRAGGGTRVKILEAAAAGVPVVSTRLGIEGLGMTPGRHVLVADAPADFAAQVTLLAGNGALRNQLVGAAFQLVRERHSIETVRTSIISALADLAAHSADWRATGGEAPT